MRHQLSALILCTAMVAASPSAKADGDQAHSTTFNQLLPGGGVVSEGLGLARRFGAPEVGVIEIEGIPPEAEVVQAYLYWVMIAGFDDTVLVNGDEYQGTWIGTTDDTCWGLGDNHVYRATVRGTVTADGIYEVTGFDYQAGVVDNQGFSIVVIYRISNSTEITQVIVNDGGVYGGSGYPAVQSTALFDEPIGDPVLRVRAHYTVGDAQHADDGDTRFNGITIATDNWEGDGCFSPGGCASPVPGGDGAMWDDDTFDLTGMGLVFPGDTQVVGSIADPGGSDCLVFASFAAEITYPNPCPDEDLDFFTTCDGDCDDQNPDVYPGAPELPDGLDNDCNGLVDDFPVDEDGDGWNEDEDCDDSDDQVFPGAEEICDNGVDDDCDGIIDEPDCSEDDGDDDDSSNPDLGDDDDDDGGGFTRRGGCACDSSSSPARGPAIAILALLTLAAPLRRRR